MTDRALPQGTVTFLFSDIEGSTRLVTETGDRYPEILNAHHNVIRTAIDSNGGLVVNTEGDSVFAVFTNPVGAVSAAVGLQRGLAQEHWPDGVDVKVRVGLHTGVGTLGGADYVGLDVHRAARIANAAHGGQTVLSEATGVLVERDLPEGVTIRDLGKFRLKDLSDPETILQAVVEDLPSEFPALRTLDLIPNNLPLQVTSFVGREQLVADAAQLLDGSRVLTLTGPGGTGKTRLSLQLAAEAGESFKDGVFFVGLSPVTDEEVVPSAVLSALGLSASGKDVLPRQYLMERMAERSLLLVLDNYEQLLGAAGLVAEMVRVSPGSKFIVTSRAPLRISGEQELPVPPLGVGMTEGNIDELLESEAVRLFAERAMAVRPEFAITPDNAKDVVALVRRLDGLPLAIELVASRVRLLPISSILERLDAGMLSGGATDLPERQRTIEGAIAWSYDLLDDAQKELFARLSVFAGGCRLEELEAVCATKDGGDLLDLLGSLIDHSLLRATDDDGRHRFRMLHVIREYAMARLEESGEADEFRRRHLAAYVTMAETIAPLLFGHERRKWLDVIDADHDNIRAALDWGISREIDLVLRLCASSWRFWQARGHLHEAHRRLTGALALEVGDDEHRADAMEALGGVVWWMGDMERCRSVYRETLELRRSHADRKKLADALYNLSLPVSFLGDQLEAEVLLDEAEAIYGALEEATGLGNVHWARGNTEIFNENLAVAKERFLRSAEYYEQSGNEFGRGWAVFELAEISLRMDDPDETWVNAEEALRLFAGHRDYSAAALLLSAIAWVALRKGDEARGMRLGGAFHRIRISSGTDLANIPFNRFEGLEYETLEALEGELGAAYREGLAMSFDRAVEYALAGPTD